MIRCGFICSKKTSKAQQKTSTILPLRNGTAAVMCGQEKLPETSFIAPKGTKTKAFRLSRRQINIQ